MSEINANIVVAPIDTAVVVNSNQLGFTPTDVQLQIYSGSQRGYQGSFGYTGSKGDPNGYSGSTGYTGSTGYIGSKGDPGGYTGSMGYVGSRGSVGAIGPQGDTGYTGSAGYVGQDGYTGSMGYWGSIGYIGSQGILGYVGSKGDPNGYTGSQGIQGELGYVGSIGFVGSIGYIGSKGDPNGYTGSQGITGYTGSSAATNIIYNGTSQVNIPSSNSNIEVQVAGVANVSVFSSGGLNTKFQQFNESVYNGGSVSGTITPNANTATIYKYTLTGNITLNSITNAVAGTSMTILLTQDATGGRTLTSTWKYTGGYKILSSAGASTDAIFVFYDGTNYYASLNLGYA